MDYAKDVEPILRARCSSCHNKSSAQGGLSLDSYTALAKGGVSGKALGRGQSVLLARIKGLGGKPRMPMGFAPLSEKDTQTIAKWLEEGGNPPAATKTVHWAYVPPVRPKVPNDGRNPIDILVQRRLAKEGLKPSPQAEKTTLIRRVTLDLTGLPPTPAEVDAFVADRSPGAYEKLVDRLFASPHYGERMALPWLDAARYADSNGFQQDGDTYQWIWRDWVVKALNANMPFDQFTVEQLAGDLLPNPTAEQVIATAFNRNHMLNGEGGAIPEEQRNVSLFDRVDTTSTTWLGLTMTCARCHDHKYDPISQRDFYSMMAFFNNVPEYGLPRGGVPYSLADPTVPVGTAEQMKRLRELREAAKSDEEQKKADEFAKSLPQVMVMSDASARKTFVYDRGNYEQPTDEVKADTPAFFPKMAAELPKNRLGLAKWMLQPENPLMARVQVNRIWQVFFGQALTKSPENFGVQSEPPIQRELLDWLAVEFRESGWDLKKLERLIVTSQTYRQSSRMTPALRVKDPDNWLLARGARFRLPSPILRDVALASSGLLNADIGGKPVYPYQPEGIWGGLAITEERDFKYPQSTGRDLYRRSLYTFWRRTVAPGNMFDASNRQVCSVRASRTSTPLHALTTLNDVTWVEAGRVLAANVMHQKAPPDERLKEAFRRVCARRPKPSELVILRRALDRSVRAFRAKPEQAKSFLAQGAMPVDPQLDPIEHAAYASVCLAIFNLDEALTRE